MLHLAEFVVRIGAYELVNDHIAATNSDNQLAVEHLGIDFARSEHVVSVSKTLDWHRATRFLDVIAKQLIQEVSRFGSICGLFRCRLRFLGIFIL